VLLVAATEAIPASLELHVIVGFSSRWPLLSITVAVRSPPPSALNERCDGEIVMLAVVTGGGGLTVTDADPVTPSLVAVMVAVPALTAVTSPVGETVATV